MYHHFFHISWAQDKIKITAKFFARNWDIFLAVKNRVFLVKKIISLVLEHKYSYNGWVSIPLKHFCPSRGPFFVVTKKHLENLLFVKQASRFLIRFIACDCTRICRLKQDYKNRFLSIRHLKTKCLWFFAGFSISGRIKFLTRFSKSVAIYF